MREIKTPQDVKAFASPDAQETLTLDFKAVINGWNPPTMPDPVERLELCRDVAQFANTSGGSLLIGVSEKRNAHGVKVATGFASVKEPTLMKEWIEQSIVNHLVPNTLDRDVVLIEHEGKQIVAVNVPPSRALVAVWDRVRSIEYPKRNSHGKFYMNPDAAERHLMDGSRATRLAIEAALKLATSDSITLVGGLWRRIPGMLAQSWKPPVITIKVDPTADWFALNVSTGDGPGGRMRTAHVPYGLVREAWVDSDNRVTLLLSVRLMYDGEGGDIGFEPI